MTNNSLLKKYVLRFTLACAAYVALVILYVLLRSAITVDYSWRYLIALLPILPVGAALYYQIMALRQADELQRTIYSESMIISALLTGFLTFSYAFLEQMGFPRFSTFYYFPVMILIWSAANFILSRRYQ